MDSNKSTDTSAAGHNARLRDHSVTFTTADATNTTQDTKTSSGANHSADSTNSHKHVRKSKKKHSKASKKQAAPDSSSSSSSRSSSSSSDSESESELSKDAPNDSSSSTSSSSSSEDQTCKKQSKKDAKKKKQKKQLTQKSKAFSSKKKKHSSKETHADLDSDSSDSEDSDEDIAQSHKKRSRRRRKGKSSKQNPYEDHGDFTPHSAADQFWPNGRQRPVTAGLPTNYSWNNPNTVAGGLGASALDGRRFMPHRAGVQNSLQAFDDLAYQNQHKTNKTLQRFGKRATTLAFKRVDQLWDSTIHNYKLTESAKDQEDEFDQYVFTVRRRFDWENKYKNTVVDIKSKHLREALQEVMKDVKGVSLVEDRPSIDPNMLFLYLEELRRYCKRTLKAKLKTEKKRKIKKKLSLTISECKVLISYLDQDYEETKKTLYPMLDAGNITFELLWALFKPNTIAFTPTYGNSEEPRCFKVDYATKESSFMRGEWYSIEGRYLEYDGKSFGLGDFEAQIDAFKGPRKITSLASYPLIYHKDPEGVKAQLIERGKKFVSLEGMNYRFHKGMAFMKKKKAVAKVNINGRIMVDPAIFRRINPNYPISTIKPKDPEEDLYGSDDQNSDCCCSHSDDQGSDHHEEGEDGDAAAQSAAYTEGTKKERTKFKVIRDKDDNIQIVRVTVDENGQEEHVENLDTLAEGADSKPKREFTEEELIIASPVVLGFAFSEKLWLEFSISGLRSIEWNEGAFDSLVLPANQKSIVKALVESHKFHAAKTIDDVVQGKGKGLVAVLHGPPGTGKTLTAEGIAELLKCPLYMVSAGELGTDPRVLEHELQKILDIAHSWGAVLLLDEADVFLEKREVHDIHRNALVSIFLRLLEYFQGILFLTTNRVETFDDAFQSRIHVALRYGELTTKAKKAVWKLFLGKVREMEQIYASLEPSATNDSHFPLDHTPPSTPSKTPENPTTPTSTPAQPLIRSTIFKESDYDTLSRRALNGRQIKNAVRTSQALAVNRKEPLAMKHILEVLEVAESFEADLKGGTGYADAMRSYT